MFRTKIKRFAEFVERYSKSSVFSWIMVAALSLTVSFLSIFSIEQIPSNLTEEMIAVHNVKADRNYEIVDDETTQKAKNEATVQVMPVYDFDTRVSEKIIKRIRDAFSSAREKYDYKSKLKPDEEKPAEIESAFFEKLGVTLPKAQWNILMEERFGEHFESILSSIIRRTMQRPIVAERGSLDAEKEKGVILRKIFASTDSETPEAQETVLNDVSRIISTEEARQQIAKSGVSNAGFRAKEAPELVISLASLLVEPNCSLNLTETEKRKTDAAANVKSSIIKIRAGEMIIREGARYEPWHIKVLKGIEKERGGRGYLLEFIGTFILALLFISIPFYLLARFFRRVTVPRSDYLLMAVVGISEVFIIKLATIIFPALKGSLFLAASSDVLMYAAPVACGAMLIRMFLCAETALVFTVAISALTGLMSASDVSFVIYCLIANLAGIISIANTDRRSRILKAGALTGLACAVAACGIEFVRLAAVGGGAVKFDILWAVFFAFTGGLASSVVVMITAPIVESVSGYISDIKLLELANLNHPLLRELIVRAPGTYHHSHLVGILGEAAAEAIAANALLVRVAAYSHDVGKIKKPLYFIENARSGENRHDKLSPNMSALILAAHVKDGEDMALAAGIPKVITDMVIEHHGTRLINFFYEKAKGREASDVQKVDEKDFSYPGPKPQTREAAILMLADAAEAAVRALKEKGTARIQQTIQRVITDIFLEKQLDDCDLTLKDLNDIARAFARILLGIYHARIEYPKETELEKPEVSVVDESSMAEDIDPKPAPKKESRSKADKGGA